MSSDTTFQGQHAGKHNQSVSLATSFMGIEVVSPLIAGSCPKNMDFEATRKLVSAGIGAIVLPSIFQEQLVQPFAINANPVVTADLQRYTLHQDRYNGGRQDYLKTIRSMKSDYAVPIIASIHGASCGYWIEYAKQIQEAGADGLEINWQIGRCDPTESSDETEARLLQWVGRMRDTVNIPIAFKMNQRITNPASLALRLQEIGIDGLVLFAHRPHWDVDLETLKATIAWELSPTNCLSQTLEGIIEVCSKDLHLSIAASGGVRSGNDAVKAIISGADVVMVVSEIYRQGADAVKEILAGIQRFMDAKQYQHIRDYKNLAAGTTARWGENRRSEVVGPLTRVVDYRDPTPVANQSSGDSFGHPAH